MKSKALVKAMKVTKKPPGEKKKKKKPKRHVPSEAGEEEEEDDDADDEAEEEEVAGPVVAKRPASNRAQPSLPVAASEWISPATHSKLEIQQKLLELRESDLIEVKVRDALGIIKGRVIMGIHQFAAARIHEGVALDAISPLGSDQEIQQWIESEKNSRGHWSIHLCCTPEDTCSYMAPEGQRIAHFDIWRPRFAEDLSEEEYYMGRFRRSVLQELADLQKFSRAPKRKGDAQPPQQAKSAKKGDEQEPPVIDLLRRAGFGPPQVPPAEAPFLRGSVERRQESDGAMRRVQDLQARVMGENPASKDAFQGSYGHPNAAGSERRASTPQEMLMERARGKALDAPLQRASEIPPPPALPPKHGQRAIFGAPVPAPAETGSIPAEKEKRKKKKKHKKHRRRHSSSSTSSSSDSDKEEGSVFRFASNREAGHENAIQELARRKPGKLLAEGMRLMSLHCNPSRALVGGTAESDALPPAAMQYLRQVLEATRAQKLGRRDTREMETLATALDHLTSGRLANLGDVLMQRFKAVETASRDQSWVLASQQELIPSTELGISTPREAEVAAKQALNRSKLLKALKPGT